MPTQVERSTNTRAALLAAARELFTEQGFAGTGREEIAERAGVTRGALYHHFASKHDAFHAVVDELEAELEQRLINEARRGGSAFDQLRRACAVYLEACADPSVLRILAVEAPAVLGTEIVRAMNDATCTTLLVPVLEAAASDGLAVPGDVVVAAQLILGMLNEAALIIATATSPSTMAQKMQPTVDAVLGRLMGAAVA